MNRPVFIIGCPRSGTTISLELMSIHESFAWISNVLNRNPDQLSLARFNRIYDDLALGKDFLLKRQRLDTIPLPVEPWQFWNNYLSKFQWNISDNSFPHRHNQNDITTEEIKTIRAVIRDLCRHQKKNRFLTKYTDFPRIKYLAQAFPDAIFIHIVRDGRAVAYSYYNAIKEGLFNTWEERYWWIRAWPVSWRKVWAEKYNTPLGFVACQWKFFVNEIWEDATYLPPDQTMEINYRDLMENPKAVLNKAFKTCGLESSDRVEWYLEHAALANMNYKWRKELNTEQIKVLEDITKDGKFKRLLDEDNG